ncbi:hypothetical protein Tco_1382841, partial [Tanacetum coccineum]
MDFWPTPQSRPPGPTGRSQWHTDKPEFKQYRPRLGPKDTATLKGIQPIKGTQLSSIQNGCGSLLWSISNVDNQHGSDIDICRTESKHISDYLVYLLVTYPVILQIDIGMIRYRDTFAAEAMRFSKKKLLLPKKLGLTLKKMEKEHKPTRKQQFIGGSGEEDAQYSPSHRLTIDEIPG